MQRKVVVSVFVHYWFMQQDSLARIISILNHWMLRQWKSPQYVSQRITLLYGMEWTTARGHAGIWSPHPFDYTPLWQDNRQQDPEAALRDAHASGTPQSRPQAPTTITRRPPLRGSATTARPWASANERPAPT